MKFPYSNWLYLSKVLIKFRCECVISESVETSDKLRNFAVRWTKLDSALRHLTNITLSKEIKKKKISASFVPREDYNTIFLWGWED